MLFHDSKKCIRFRYNLIEWHYCKFLFNVIEFATFINVLAHAKLSIVRVIYLLSVDPVFQLVGGLPNILLATTIACYCI